jgi:hypothetical protein
MRKRKFTSSEPESAGVETERPEEEDEEELLSESELVHKPTKVPRDFPSSVRSNLYMTLKTLGRSSLTLVERRICLKRYNIPHRASTPTAVSYRPRHRPTARPLPPVLHRRGLQIQTIL